MEAATDIDAPAKNPATRQVLVNIGNRYVVFGTPNAPSGRHVLGPDDVRQRFSERVGDEYDFSPDRLVQSVQVDDAGVILVYAQDRDWDLELIYPDGSKSPVEIKIRMRDIRGRDADHYLSWLKEVKATGVGDPEVWNFNIERLRLNIMVVDAGGIPRRHELEPLNIWEFNADGGAFERSYVVERVADWVKRVGDIYANVEDWSSGLGVAIDKSRTVRMSEDLMQKFAVPDRELAVLDMSKDGNSLLSFVPAGLWILGSNGRVDIISRHGTVLLLNEARLPEPPRWSVRRNKSERNFEPWRKETFLKLVRAAETP